MKQMGTNTETHSQTLCERKKETLAHIALSRVSLPNPSPQNLENLVKEVVEMSIKSYWGYGNGEEQEEGVETIVKIYCMRKKCICNKGGETIVIE